MEECKFREMKKNNADLQHFLKNKYVDIDEVTPLNARDAFYGGRTNCLKAYYDCKEGEKIKYLDIISLYPTVQKVNFNFFV